MTDLWGISGPRFIELHAGVLWRQWQIKRVEPGGRQRSGITLHHLAYLASGRERAAESAVASLLDGGRLRADKAVLHKVGKAEPGSDHLITVAGRAVVRDAGDER